MKIALYHNLPSGGAKRAIFETVRRLTETHIVDVYTLSTASHDFCDLRPFVNEHRIFQFNQFPLFNSPFGRLNQLQRYRTLHALDSFEQTIAAEIDRRRYDLAFVLPSMWVQAPSVLNYLETKTVYFVHEPLRSVYEPIIPRPYIKNGWRQKLDNVDPLISLYRRQVANLDRRNTRHANYLLANSRFTATNVERIYNHNADVSYLGVDSSIFSPLADAKKENFVLSVGELRPHKGYDFLIRAIGRIPESRRPPLRIIGNANDQAEHSFLVSLARENSVDLTVEVMVDLDTLIKRYNQAALFVYSPVREPFGLVPLEAMACATAVVGVAEGGVKETVLDQQTGLLVERNPEAFAAAIEHLLGNPKLAAEYGQNGRDYVVRDWNWDKSTAQLIDHFNNFIMQHQSFPTRQL
jgi:glycosyltransferase involved in cell wall biosynthesis